MNLSVPDLADPTVAAELLSLQHEAYRVEADLVGDDRLPPLLAGEDEISAWSGRMLVARDEAQLLGAVAWQVRADLVDVDRLWVHPSAHRRGVATTLLGRVLEAAGSRAVEVSTARDNVPAVTLYLRLGFGVVAEERTPTGLWLAHLRRPGGGRQA